jgi:long-chain acyl-CoA synthetase
VVASPINPEYRTREIEYQFENSDSKAVVCDAEREEWAEPVAADLGLDVISTDPDSDHTTLDDLSEQGEPTLVEREDDDTLLQPYTSGTTGKPKGVLLTHKNFRVQIIHSVSSYSSSAMRLLDPDSLIVFPMYHITGMNNMLFALCAGRTFHVLRPDQWDPERVLDTLDEHDIPVFGGVATMFMDLLNTYKQDPDRWDLSTLLRAGQGGDKLPEPVHEEFEERFEVAVSEGYGLTETTAGTHTISSSTIGDKVGSIGQPMGHTDSKVIDPQTGEEVEDGEEGELVLRGPQVMKGYYNRPEANEEAFTDDGFFRTGDVATRDSDNYYYIKGREKDMILTAGYNVYPSEVEQVLYDHPEIHEAAVFGVPDERRGETVAAAVTLVDGADITGEEIKQYVLEEIAPYKHPRTVEVMEELPKTGSGKIRKVELREQFSEEDANA